MKTIAPILFACTLDIFLSCRQHPKENIRQLKPLCNYEEKHPVCYSGRELLPVRLGKFEIEIQAHKDSIFFQENQHLAVEGRFKHIINNKENNFKEFLHFIINNLKYPEMERESEIQGNMYYRINLDKKNICGKPEALRSVSPGLKAETMRVLNMLSGSRITTHPIKTTYLIIKIRCLLVD